MWLQKKMSCCAYNCKGKADTTVCNENGEWTVCFKHINYFDIWNEGLAPPVDWRWLNEASHEFNYLADAGVQVSATWVGNISRGSYPDRYTELYMWLLERAPHIPPHHNPTLLREFIKLYFRYAEFGVNTFEEHFDTVIAHPLFDPVMFMKVFLMTIINHELGRRTLKQVLAGPCQPLVFMAGDVIDDIKCRSGVLESYKELRAAEKKKWRAYMRLRLDYKEDLIAAAWHPIRVSRWIEAGYDLLEL